MVPAERISEVIRCRATATLAGWHGSSTTVESATSLAHRRSAGLRKRAR
jgi:hypothetical protein